MALIAVVQVVCTCISLLHIIYARFKASSHELGDPGIAWLEERILWSVLIEKLIDENVYVMKFYLTSRADFLCFGCRS